MSRLYFAVLDSRIDRTLRFTLSNDCLVSNAEKYTVDIVDGADFADCGTVHPCKTLAYAINSYASNGNTISLKRGVYTVPIGGFTIVPGVSLEGEEGK